LTSGDDVGGGGVEQLLASAAAVDERDTHQPETVAGMLGLPGCRVLACSELESELPVQVETTQDLVGCPSCAAVAVCRSPGWASATPPGR